MTLTRPVHVLTLALGLAVAASTACDPIAWAAENADFACTEVSVSASAGGTSVKSINTSRRFLSLHNTEDQAMSCDLAGGTPTTSSGTLVPAGSAWTYDQVVPKGAVACISHSGSKKVRVCEGT